MFALFLCVVMICLARSQSQSSIESEAHEMSDEYDVTAPATSSESAMAISGDSKLWLGLVLCLCHAWLFSGVGVISRRLQSVHFSVLMLHQAVQGIVLIGAVLAA